MKRTLLFALLLGVIVSACKEPFDAHLRPEQTNYLVVEGYINVTGYSTISLSRTQPLNDSTTLKKETNATVTIEGEDNSSFPLSEIGDGSYTTYVPSLSPLQQYRLHIKTTTGGEYLSAFSKVRETPNIDNVSWKQKDNGIEIYVDTHDPQDSTRYYKWDYVETWEIHSAYSNLFRYENGLVTPRAFAEIRTFIFLLAEPKLIYHSDRFISATDA